MLTLIKSWFGAKMIPIAIITGSILVASLGTMTVLYKLKDKDLQLKSGEVATLVVEKTKIKAELDGLTEQLKNERERHIQLEADLKKLHSDYVSRQADLEKQKKNIERKGMAKKNPKAYEIEVQKATDDYINRMNCITGNAASCSKS